MNTAVINIKTSPQTKRQAHMVARNLGFSLSSLVNAFLKQLIKTKSVSFSVKPEVPSQYLIDSLKQSGNNHKKGKRPYFCTGQEMSGYIDEIIKIAQQK